MIEIICCLRICTEAVREEFVDTLNIQIHTGAISINTLVILIAIIIIIDPDISPYCFLGKGGIHQSMGDPLISQLHIF